MKRFAQLFAELDRSTATLAKVDALKRYFASAAPRDAAWAVYFLAGGKPRQVVPNAVLWATACQRAGIDEWLFDACYQAVGDFAETVAHVLPPAERLSDLGLADWVEERLLPLRGLSPIEQSERVAAHWGELDAAGRFLLNKLIGGEFRIGVSKLLVQRALAEGSPRRPSPVRSTSASRIRSSSPIRSTSPSRSSKRSSPRPRNGRSSGSTTASAPRSSSARVASGSGRAARSSSPSAFPKSSRWRSGSPTAPCSTASSSPGAKAACCRSRCCSSGSDASR